MKHEQDIFTIDWVGGLSMVVAEKLEVLESTMKNNQSQGLIVSNGRIYTQEEVKSLIDFITISAINSAQETGKNNAYDVIKAMFEKTLVENALKMYCYNKTKAHTVLGIQRSTLYAKIAEYKL